MTQMDPTSGYGAGIHWQVAQATSLQNIVFNMVQGGDKNKQQGIFMDNGSANFMGDLIFNGGNICMFMGNQVISITLQTTGSQLILYKQFTVRNVTFNGCQTAIYQNWGWVWNYKHMVFNDCNVGLDITSGIEIQSVGSVILGDSIFNNVQTGILTAFSGNSTPVAGGSLVVDNCDFTGAEHAIVNINGTLILDGGVIVDSFVQGRAYTTYFTTEIINNKTCLEPGANGARIQSLVGAPPKPSLLLDGNGMFVERFKPQYENEPLSAFISVKDHGCVGDGLADDTAAIQAIFDKATFDDIIYFDHGAYLISDTIRVPTQIRITGEIWPLIMVDGSSSVFSDPTNPKPAWQVGKPNDVGRVEMSELVFETRGPAPGAIIVEWNLAGESPGDAGECHDVHPAQKQG